MSPIVMWKTLIAEYFQVNSMVVVCNQPDFADYEALVSCCHLNDVTIVSVADLDVDLSSKVEWVLVPGFLINSKIEVMKGLQKKSYVTSSSVFVCYQACIPSKGLNLSIIRDYYDFKKAKCVYLYSYTEDLT